MPQLQNVVLKDRKSTPVDHTFTPRDIRDGVGTVIETTGIPVGNPRLSVSLRQTPNGRYKGEVKLVAPVMVTETINGVAVQRVDRTSTISATFDYPATSTEAERNDIVGMFADALAPTKTLVNDTVVKLQGVY